LAGQAVVDSLLSRFLDPPPLAACGYCVQDLEPRQFVNAPEIAPPPCDVWLAETADAFYLFVA
jgi:hypothetical protein